MQIIFCDVDEKTSDFLKTVEKIDGVEFITFAQSLNDIDEKELAPYYGAEIISTFVYSRLGRDLLSKFPNLKMISTRSTGYNNVDLDYCREKGIKVANVVGYGEITVAEFAVGVLLNLTRKIRTAQRKLKHGIVNVEEDIGIDLYGKTVGVIGTGAIGRHFARLIKAFGCKVLAYDLYPNKALEEEGTCKYTDLETIYKESDIIGLNCPATKENYHLINADTIKKMKDGVFIVNTARGELIDTAALYDSLVSGKVAGAGLDVLDYEDVILKNDIDIAKNKDKDFIFYSLVNQKLVQLENAIVTPHIAFNSIEANLRILNTSMKHVIDFINGVDIKSVA